MSKDIQEQQTLHAAESYYNNLSKEEIRLSNYNGVVSKIFPKSNWGTYSFGMQGQRGYYNMGKIPPFFSEGQTIEFDGTPGKREGNVDVNANTIKVVTEEQVQPKDYNMPKTETGARKVQVLQKDDYWQRREERDVETQKRIEIQACRNAAIQLVQAVGLEPGVSAEDFINGWTDMFIKNNNDRLAV